MSAAGRRHTILAANWKMHHGPSATRAFADAFVARYRRRDDRTVAFFPSAISLTTLAHGLRDHPELLVGVQNIHTEEKGAFTGEVSAPMAADAGARLALVGHSERRHLFGETDAQTARKCVVALQFGLAPMLCVGERLEEREAGETDAVVVRQLRAALASLDAGAASRLHIAYEPVWAIGTGKTATPADASAVHAVVRRTLQESLGPAGTTVPILYGGSVNPGNARALLDAPGVDGLLVGGASLEPASWLAIVDA